MARWWNSCMPGALVEKNQRGFSLIELLIVVAIILVISAIAIPNLLRSKEAANEASAVESMRTLNSASITYSNTYGGYPKALKRLGPSAKPSSTSADLIDDLLASGVKSGYSFTWSAGVADAQGDYSTYSIKALPVKPQITGQRYFYTDQTGVIRSNTTKAATINSTPLN